MSGCVADCMASDTGLSAGCSACFGDAGECGMDNCGALCGDAPGSEECNTCIDEHCGAAFETCSGVPLGS